jgi:DNA (cytosine-5)-methyltransferase 1
VEHRELIAYEYGTPTTRKRFFMIARCDGQPIVWPTPTHGKPSNPRVKSGELKPWRTAAECIDWSIPCPSIFERERPLAEATLRRIAKGIQKYVIDAKNPFIVTCNHSGDGFRGQGLSEPFKTVTSSRDAHGLVVPTLVQTGYGERPGQEPRVPGLDKPLGTAMAQGIKHGLVAATLMHYRDAPGEQIRNVDLEAPLGTVTAGGVQHALAVATLLKHYGGNNKAAGSDLNEPMHTVTTQDHHSLLTANLVRHFGTSNGADVDAPVGTITTEGAGKTAVVVSHLTRFRGDNVSDVTEPIPTIVASGVNIGEVRAFLAKYYGDDENHQSVDEPLHTIPTRDRFALVTIQNVDYVIVDIGMRMLKPHELFKAQGFPDDYIITPEFKGKPLTKTAQVKMCGNSVPPPMAEAIVRANVQLAEKTARRA